MNLRVTLTVSLNLSSAPLQMTVASHTSLRGVQR